MYTVTLTETNLITRKSATITQTYAELQNARATFCDLCELCANITQNDRRTAEIVVTDDAGVIYAAVFTKYGEPLNCELLG